MSKIQRRDLLIAAGALVLAPPRLIAQPSRALYRVALVFTTSSTSEMVGPEASHPSAKAFVDALRSLGYRHGESLQLEARSAEGKFDRFRDIFAELVGAKTDVIVVVGHPSIIAAAKQWTSVPIVLTPSYFDPVEAGLAMTLSRPGRNVTGFSITPSPEIEAKRLELLKEALPNVRRVAFLGLITDWTDDFGRVIQNAAKVLGISVFHTAHTPTDYSSAFATIVQGRPDAVIVANSPVNFANRERIVEFMVKNKLPSMFSRREYVVAGGLLSYGVNITDLFRRAAVYVDKIIQGAKPADLPIEQPTTFELFLNLKEARRLGLNIPRSILLRADRVLESPSDTR